MNLRKNKVYQNSKLYNNPNSLSICLDNDNYHQKMWREKQEQPKNTQTKKRIDKILQCVIKQRMFGNLMKHQHKISNQINQSRTISLAEQEIYYSIQSQQLRVFRDNIKKSGLSKQFQKHKQRKQISSVQISKTIDVNSKDSSDQLKIYQNKLQIQSGISLDKIKNRNIAPVKLFSISKIPQFSKFFKKLCNNQKSMIFQLKLNRQHLLQKCKGIMHQQIMQQFLYFFNFPPSNQYLSYRQYCNWIQKVMNCPLKDIQFFIFRLLDQSKNGVVTITDLFQLMMFFPNNDYIEKQLYEINQQISIINKQKSNKIQNILIKSSVEQLLALNHNLKLQQVRQLMKQGSNQLKSINCVRSTIYHQSVLSLEHDWKQRMKINQIQTSVVQNRQKKSTIKRDGMGLADYIRLYKGKKSRIFCQIIELLTGQKISELQ